MNTGATVSRDLDEGYGIEVYFPIFGIQQFNRVPSNLNVRTLSGEFTVEFFLGSLINFFF